MNLLKRMLGLFWLLLGPAAIAGLIFQAAKEIGEKNTQENWIFWGIIITIFQPIAGGMSIFGYYCLKGEYDRLPASSAEIED